jgi:hypothetical protein
MDAGMSTEKFITIITCLKEARSAAAALTLPPESRPNAHKLRLLWLLDRIQHLVVSLRADFIDLFYFRGAHEKGVSAPCGADGPTENPPAKTGTERKPNVIPFDRRRMGGDRRRTHTYIAHDQRSGIADRRRRKQNGGGTVQASPVQL